MMARSRRSARQAAYNLRYSNGAQTTNHMSAVPKPFIEYVIKDSDIMIICDPDYILPQQYLWSKYMVKNNIFPNKKIPADKIGIVYSPKKKLYYMLVINENYTCFILFKAKELKDLPNISRIWNLEKVDTTNMYQTVEDSNRKIIGVMRYEPIWDLTINPIISYKPTELFKK